MIHQRNHIALCMIAIAVTIFVAALYVYFHISINASRVRAIEARTAAANEQTYQSQRQSLSELYAVTKEGRAAIGSFFVADDKKVPFIETIEAFGSTTQAKVTLSGIVADDLATSPVGTLGKISVRVDATGSWPSVMRVLRMAETLEYKSSVNSVRVDVVKDDKPDAKRQWHLSFVLEAVSIRRALTSHQ